MTCRRTVVAVVATLLGGALLVVLFRAAIPGDGIAIRRTLPSAPAEGVLVSFLPGADTNLRTGDVVTAVHRPPGTLSVGDQVTYTAWRDGQPFDGVARVKSYPWRALVANEWPTGVLVASFLVVALYVFSRRPDDRAAQVLLVASALLVLAATSWVLRLQLTDVGHAGWWLFLVGAIAYALVWAAVLHFAVVFPTTRSIARRWTGVALIYAAPLVLHGAYLAVVLPGIPGRLPRARLTVATAVLSEYVFPVAIVAVLVWSYRTCREALTRQRLRWITGSFLLASILYLVLWKLPYGLGSDPFVSRELHTLVFLPCPVALAAAVLRTQLFDIEVIVRRSLVYVSLTGCVIAIYALAVGLLSALFDRGDGLVPLVATGLVAVLFSPLRDRLQSAVSRMVYGERDDPYALVARLGQRLEGTLVPDEILPTVVETVAEALRLPYVAIDLDQPHGPERVAECGSPTPNPLSLPITHRGEKIGSLVLGERTPGETFGPADLRVLEGLARQVAVAAQTVRLTRELQQSRERLVAAREEERRRVRRDLHDGLGPTLASTTLQLAVANRLVHSDPDAASAVLTEVSAEVRGAIADIRRIVDDLRPPALDELGLVSAVEQRASSLSTGASAAADGDGNGDGMIVSVKAEGDFESLPAAVEVAAFRIVCEAMNNASRHSGAHRCEVRLARNSVLEVEVADDGRGLPATYIPGVGLASMRERAAELGGVCTIERRPEGGTVVSARLPLLP